MPEPPSIAHLSQLRDASRIHLATRTWDEATATAYFSLLCGQKRALLKTIDPDHYEQFGWNALPSLRCKKCSEAWMPTPKKGVA